MGLIRACGTSDVQPGKMKFVHVGDRDLLIANVDGRYHAIHNWCTHEEGNLSDGELKRNVVTCPEHGAQFDVTTGKVLGGPEGEAPDSIKSEKTFKATVQGIDLMVDIP
jgi:nitrite reductase/ring-hydroxylating ferredoxin subunit